MCTSCSKRLLLILTPRFFGFGDSFQGSYNFTVPVSGQERKSIRRFNVHHPFPTAGFLWPAFLLYSLLSHNRRKEVIFKFHIHLLSPSTLLVICLLQFRKLFYNSCEIFVHWILVPYPWSKIQENEEEERIEERPPQVPTCCIKNTPTSFLTLSSFILSFFPSVNPLSLSFYPFSSSPLNSVIWKQYKIVYSV